ncbi:MAG: hypothetical protein QN174_07610 [Armatimonadota bacterium]|nr:hypothetical protein [Armatimonadota bacterium]
MAIERRRVPGTMALVDKVRIAGTSVIVYRAWEPSALRSTPSGGHTTLTYLAEHEVPAGMHAGWYGDVARRGLPPDLAALPAYSDERYTRVTEWQRGQQECAYAMITTAYPEAAAGARRWGEIEARDA